MKYKELIGNKVICGKGQGRIQAQESTRVYLALREPKVYFLRGKT